MVKVVIGVILKFDREVGIEDTLDVLHNCLDWWYLSKSIRVAFVVFNR